LDINVSTKVFGRSSLKALAIIRLDVKDIPTSGMIQAKSSIGNVD
jgi:hypothetical protein